LINFDEHGPKRNLDVVADVVANAAAASFILDFGFVNEPLFGGEPSRAFVFFNIFQKVATFLDRYCACREFRRRDFRLFAFD